MKKITPQMRRRLRDRNRRFAKMNAARKRVTIAKDVLELLSARRITPRSAWTYVGSPLYPEDSEGPMAEAIAAAPRCEVCAVGGMFLAAAMRRNDLQVDDLDPGDGRRIKAYLARFFERRQLELIETAFEGRFGTTRLEVRAERFASRVSSDVAALKKIMHNIIEHDGRFVP